MIELRVRIDADKALAAFARVGEVMRRHVLEGTEEGGQVVARDAGGRVNSKHSNLVNSIGVAPLEEGGPQVIGHEVRAGMAYAPYVELGTGPAAGQPRYYPNPDSLLDYLRTVRSSRAHNEIRGQRRDFARYELWHRSRAWAWHIYQHGTRAHPFMQPAAEANFVRVCEIVRAAVARGVVEVFGAG